MAGDVEKKIVIKYSSTGMPELTRQMENYNRSLRSTTTTNQKLNMQTGQWNTTSQSIKSTTSATQRLGGALNGAMMKFIGINALIGLGEKAFEALKEWVDASVVSFRSFEYRIAEVSSILDATTRDTLPSLSVGISQLAITYGKSVEDLTKGLYEIVSAAFEVDDAMNLLNTVTKASIAGLTTVEGAVKTFTGVLNAYGQSAAHAAELSDQMFEAVIRGNFTFKDLEGSLGYVVPIAANLGVSFEEVAAALATATRQGQHIDSVTRGLGLLMQGIVDPTKEASEAAKEYGIDMSATALRIGGLEGFLNQLSEATSKYGAQILPELIGNMRSLRVAMALTGKTGIAGFTEDMDLITNATGKTDAALSAMMNTQQTMANILGQQMEQVNRQIGDAWSGVDIWWKKAELWWKTLLSGGDADKAVQAFDSAVEKIRQSYIKNIVEPVSESKATVFDQLFGSKIEIKGPTGMKDLIKDITMFGDIKHYLDVSEQADSLNKETTAANNAKVALESLQYQATEAGKALNKKSLSPLRYHYDQNMNKGMEYVDENTLKIANAALKTLGMTTLSSKTTLKELSRAIDDVKSKSSDLGEELEIVIQTETDLRPRIDEVVAAFEDASAAISNNKENIISLEAEIKKINEDITDMYKGFQGKLRYEIEVTTKESEMDHFEEYAKMAAKYGSEYINEWTNVFDEYGNNMSDVLKTIYEYNDALAEQARIAEETKQAQHDLEIQMQKNNLEMLKLQLAGMMRRRGNTRAEQRAMKQLEVENTKLRIEEMQRQLENEESGLEESQAAKETAYDEAEKILQAYIDYEQHQMWVLKDTRDEDIADLQESIKEQEELLTKRTQMLTDEFLALNTMQQRYQDVLVTVANDPELRAAYEKLLGKDVMDEALSSYENYIQFVSDNPIAAAIGGSAGGGVAHPGIYRVVSTNPPPDFVGPVLSRSATSSSGATHSYNWKTGIGDKSVGSLKIGDTVGWARGTNFIPETGMYKLHKYEQVLPAGSEGGSITNSVVININNPQVANEQDVSKLARTIENVMRANLTDKKYGRSKHRIA